MASITAEGPGGYSQALKVKAAFKESGIESGETIGGLWVLLDECRIQEAQNIVAKFDWSLRGGCTTAMQVSMENMSIENGDTDWMITAKRSADAESVIQEWT